MIQHIRISNFAIIEDVEIEFHDGLQIVTGETGAGKSIVIEAMSLALGSRADTTYVRTGCDRAIVQMVAFLEGDEYIITREVSSNGRNLCRINGEIVTLSQLTSLCKRIADIHGQYDHQSLLDPEKHIGLLDRYGGAPLTHALSETGEIYSEYSKIRDSLQKVRTRRAEDQRQRDFMEFEFQELTSADLKPGEDVDLREKVTKLQHSEQIYEDLAAAYEISEGSEYSVTSALRQISDRLSSAASWSSDAGALSERISSIYYELEDINSEIRRSRDEAVFSPEELDLAIERLDMIERLKQKHDKSLDELIEYHAYLEKRLDDASMSEETESELSAQLLECRQRLDASFERLTDLRKKAAERLEKEISEELKQLNFGQTEFRVDFGRSDTPAPTGIDIVEFLISTNRGEDLKPLSKIASGGEMSRIMLAFKKITGDYDDIPTMIFDEIDSGISGITASIVGRKLHEISENHQIICITHLPQIAACGDHHYRISKDNDDRMTYTVVRELGSEEKVTEIARLLGGADVTETTLDAARELIEASH